MLQARSSNKPVNPIQYPVLRRSKRTGTVVLFHTRFRGMTVIAQNQAHSQDVGKTHSWTEPCDNEAAWEIVEITN